MEWLIGLFKNSSLLMQIAPIIIGVNVVLSALSSVLDYFKDKTKSDVDDKASAAVHKVLDVLKKIVDWLSANKEH